MAETKIEVEVVAEGNPAPHPSDMVSIVGESEFFPAISTFIEPTDDQVNKSYADVLSEVVRQRSLLKSDLLAKKLRYERDILKGQHATFSKAMFSSQPFVVVTNIPIVWRIFAASSLFFLGYCAYVLWYMVNLGLPSHQHYKFTTLERRDNITAPVNPGPGILRFGLISPETMVMGCSALREPSLNITSDQEMILSFWPDAGKKRTAPWSGWYIITSAVPNSEGEDPIRFRLDGSDDLTRWTPVASPSFFNFGSRNVLVENDYPYKTPLERRRKAHWIMTPHFGCYFAYFGVWLGFFVLLAGCTILVWLNISGWIQTHVPLAVFFMGLTCLVGGIGFVVHSEPEFGGSEKNANFWFTCGGVYFFWSLFVFIFPNAPEIFLMGASGTSLFLQVAFTGQVNANTAISVLPPVIVGIVLLLFRIRINKKIFALMKENKRDFDMAWQFFKSETPDAQRQVALLNTVVRTISTGIPQHVEVRQLNLKMRKTNTAFHELTKVSRIFGFFSSKKTAEHKGPKHPNQIKAEKARVAAQADSGNIPRPGQKWAPGVAGNDWSYAKLLSSVAQFDVEYVPDRSNQIKSIDQLYSQATLVRGSLFPLVVRLANRHRGLFPLREGPGVFAHVERPFDREHLKMFRFGGIKGIQKCIDKIDIAYGGDVSLLLDVCRERVVFENLSDLTRALAELSKDPTVRILRIRNSIGSEGDEPKVPTGFRHVSVNIQISTEQTRRLCVDQHICEVLFVLKRFAVMIDSPDMRQRYTLFRNATLANLRSSGAARVTQLAKDLLVWGCCGPSNRVKSDDLPETDDPALRSEFPSSQDPRVFLATTGSTGAPAPELPRPMLSTALSMQALTPAPFRVCLAGDTGCPGPAPDVASPSSITNDDDAAPPRASFEVGSYGGGENTKERGSIVGWIHEGIPVRDVNTQKWQTSWGVQLDNATMRVLETIARLTAMGYSNILTASMGTSHWLGLETASQSSILFTSKPLTASSVKIWPRLVIVIIGFVYLVPFILSLANAPSTSKAAQLGREFKHFRYTNYAARNGSLPLTTGVRSFLPAINTEHDGCMMKQRATQLYSQGGGDYEEFNPVIKHRGTSIFVTYSKPVPYHGYSLSVGGDDGSSDTRSFGILASASTLADATIVPEEEWVKVGSPVWRPSWPAFELIVPSFGNDMVSMPPAADGPTDLLFFEGDGWTKSVKDLVLAVGLLGFAFFGWLRLADYARMFIVVMMFVYIFFSIDYGIYRAHLRNSIFLAFSNVTIAVVGFLGCYYEQYFLHFLVLNAAISALDGVVDLCLSPSIPGSGVPIGDNLIVSTLIVIGAIIIITARWIAINKSTLLVANDRAIYDALWQCEMQNDAGVNSVKHLGEVIRMLGLDVTDDQTCSSSMHQMNRSALLLVPESKNERKSRIAPRITRDRVKGDDLLFRSLNRLFVPRTVDKGSHIQCLDQLYVQAIVANTMLVQKVQQWAAKSNGYFRLKKQEEPNPRARPLSWLAIATEKGLLEDRLANAHHNTPQEAKFVKWTDAADQPGLIDRIKWPPIKLHRRTVEKLMRVYNNDVSRIVDISRQSIFFDSFTDLTMCLGEIVTDLDVKVERIKGRMSVKYDSSATAGYRDVALNVKVDNDMACMLGCDMHLCEVQLLLRKFGELKTEEGHRRYVQLRDARAE